ncbi:ATP-binding cassette domain-containing protein [Glutamicibacter sp. NPDC087344]|uniref:ATP-binding cassette domain-containing protein n=1 Tax=Glutamicibacter sp. NPDC087344 TaxID=3363994 RepID=UPI003826A77B
MALIARLEIPRTGFTVSADFTVESGKVLALMGPSGAGKSSIVHTLAGVEKLGGGLIELDGTVLADARTHVPPHLRKIGLLGQDPHLFPHLDAAKNIAFGARAGGLESRAATAEASAWLERLGLSEIARHRPGALSGGQRQRIALARALAARPRLLLIDEPFASLDVEAAADMRLLVREQLARTGISAVIVSHAAVDTQELADDLLVIERGAATHQGPTAQVFANPATRFMRAVIATLPAGAPPELKEATDGA